MPPLQAVHGRIVDLRRYTNVHLCYGRRPFGPTDRYELWVKQPDGVERKFTVNTRTMPARRGHEVSLIVTAHKVPQVLGLANWSTIDGVNYVRTDALPLVRVQDFVVLSAAFLAVATLYGDVGMVLFVPAAVAYLLAAGLGRAMLRTRRAAQVDRAIDAEALQRSRSARTLQ
ncbi:MAG TPA: hypothetical protein PLR02_14075 [Rhodocyclaceae bacterium]|nr:hypothetical protein [Rhodocyclaceae bacterium]